MQLKKLITQGQVFPFGHAEAYYDFVTNCNAVYPIGIHWIVRWYRSFLYWLHARDKMWWEAKTEEIADYHESSMDK